MAECFFVLKKMYRSPVEDGNPVLGVVEIQMKTKFLKETIDYTGEQLSSLWAYKTAGLQGDSIVSFIGKADVSEHLVDLEDVKAMAFIYSEQMLHFIVEHFELDLEKAVLRQRMLMMIIQECLALEGSSPVIERRGDDLFIEERKLSVSIATLSPVSSLIHVGLNIRTENTPVPAFGLNELMKISAVPAFAEKVLESYATEMADINLARCKVRGVS